MIALEIVRRVVRILVHIKTIHIQRVHWRFRILLVRAEIAIVPGTRKVGIRFHILLIRMCRDKSLLIRWVSGESTHIGLLPVDRGPVARCRGVGSCR